MIKLKDLLRETWNSDIWSSHIWNSDIWNPGISSHHSDSESDELMETDNKKEYQHNCVHKNDDYSNSIFSDATHMDQSIKNSLPISISEFLNKVNINENSPLGKFIEKYPTRFDFGKHENLMWAHDNKTDIHYFFV